MTNDVRGPSDGNERIQELQRQIDDLRWTIGNVAQATALENVVQQGFEKLSNQLEPLRDMSPDREVPVPELVQKFNAILKAIEQPRWRGSDFEAEKPKNDSSQRSQS